MVNDVTEKVKTVLATRRAELVRLDADRLLQDDNVDVTLEAWTAPAGTEHLIQQTIEEVCEIFIGLGYRVAEGPEAELGWYNFGALNTPPTHPSRLESDTLYLDFGDPADEILLRTQTSPMQARYMEAYEPPVYVVVPGKTYRADAIDASHLPVFHQIEGLAVDSGITLPDLKGTLAYFAREFFGPQGRDPPAVPLLSFHRTFGRARRVLLRLRGDRAQLPIVRGSGLARDGGVRDGRSQRLPGRSATTPRR